MGNMDSMDHTLRKDWGDNMGDDYTTYERLCKEKFDILFRKLDAIDAHIRGNGGPGLTTRVERNTMVIKSLLWINSIATGAFIAGAVKLWMG